MAEIQTGYLMIADISGYTAFLTRAELKHARDILDQLLNTLLGALHPPLAIGNLEGDAIFVYAPEGSFLQGQTLVETVEKIYFAFCMARDNIQRSCKCNACSLVSSLDLKFVVHHGQYVLQTLGTRTELQGADVIMAHRLLKNSITEATGITAYAFFSEASVERLSMGELSGGMIPHAEEYEHVGQIGGFVHNLAPLWTRERARARDYISPGMSWVNVTFDLPVPPALAWDYLNEPKCACEWCGMDSITLTNVERGRLGVGSGRTCVHAHGKQVTVERIMDYQPFDYITVESTEPNGTVSRMTTQISATPEGSRISWQMSAPVGRNRFHTLVVRGQMALKKREVAGEIRRAGIRLREMIAASRNECQDECASALSVPPAAALQSAD
jgi:hypothetical protein